MKQWHYSINGKQFGPTPEDQLISMIHSKSITKSDYVWTEGLTAWVRISDSSLSKYLKAPTSKITSNKNKPAKNHTKPANNKPLPAKIRPISKPNKVIFYGPHGIHAIFSELTLLSLAIIVPLIILPVSINFELTKGAIIFILVFIAALVVAIRGLIPPSVYCVYDEFSITYKSGWLIHSKTSILIEDIEEILVLNQTETTKVFYVVTVSKTTSETGIILIDWSGKRHVIHRGCFNREEDYERFKWLLFKSPRLTNLKQNTQY